MNHAVLLKKAHQKLHLDVAKKADDNLYIYFGNLEMSIMRVSMKCHCLENELHILKAKHDKLLKISIIVGIIIFVLLWALAKNNHTILINF